jgi:hypothetical protein
LARIFLNLTNIVNGARMTVPTDSINGIETNQAESPFTANGAAPTKIIIGSEIIGVKESKQQIREAFFCRYNALSAEDRQDFEQTYGFPNVLLT